MPTEALLNYSNPRSDARSFSRPAYEVVLILDFLAGSSTSQGVNHIARTLKLSCSKTSRILAALSLLGIVLQNPTDSTYKLGPRFVSYASAFHSQNPIITDITHALSHISEELNETVSFAVLHGTTVFYVNSIESRLSVRVGSKHLCGFPLRESPAGILICSHLSDADAFTTLLPPRITSQLHSLHRSASSEFLDNGTINPDVHSYSQLIVTPDQRIVGAIEVSLPRTRNYLSSIRDQTRSILKQYLPHNLPAAAPEAA